jgi:hypothetical protein
MKYLKMLGLAAVAAMALMAFLGAGSASATVFCKVTEVPCSEANEWAVGTFGDATQKAGSSGVMKTTEGTIVETCTEVTVSGKLQTKGGPTETVKETGGGENVVWKNCTNPMVTIKGGEIEVHHITGTDNGTVTMKGFETTMFISSLGLSCIYTYGAGIDVGIITGGTKPSMDLNAALPRSASSSAFCPATIVGSVEGTLTEPTGAAYVLAS